LPAAARRVFCTGGSGGSPTDFSRRRRGGSENPTAAAFGGVAGQTRFNFTDQHAK